MSSTIKAHPRTTQELPPLPTLRMLYSGEAGVIVSPPVSLRAGVTAIGRGVAEEGGLSLKEDGRLSRRHVTFHVQPFAGPVEVADEGSTNGTTVNGRPVTHCPLKDGDVVRIGDSFLLLRHQPARLLDTPIPTLLGTAPVMQVLRDTIRLAAKSDATILLLGESGCGKDVAANALHRLSARAGSGITVFDCGAVARDLIESELFGHEKGAFTGATRTRQGVFETAHGGTLFLDEVGELPLDLQPKLLRALEQREVRRVGDTRPIKVDTRIVAATNRDLAAAVRAGTFRPDLYARLAEITLRLPPLRERREDILQLFQHAMAPAPFRPSPSLVEALLLYPWPYNVREVFKVAAQLRAFGADHKVLDVDLLAGRLDAMDPEEDPSGGDLDDPEMTLPRGRLSAVPTRDELTSLLVANHGNVCAVARTLGKSRRQVHRWLAAYQIDTKKLRRSLSAGDGQRK